MTDLRFNRTVSFLGRNGMFKQSGIAIMKTGDKITLEPITSQNMIGRAWIEIPSEEIDNFVAQITLVNEGKKV